jgi:hypothetical protein
MQKFFLRILRNEHVVNNDEANEIRTRQQQDHISFLQSFLISSMITNMNDEQKELNINKENQL